jgi:hypothetical protein
MTLRSPRSEFVRKALLALAPAVLLLATAASAEASTRQETILQDDRLFGDPAVQVEALDTADSLGVDTIHSVITFRSLAPEPEANSKPGGFDAADPADYPAENWDRFDTLVREADRRGIELLFSPSTPMPDWAAGCTSRRGTPAGVCEPDEDEYEDFFAAVVRRYSGSYSDENQGGGRLPKVDRFSVANEPNLTAWLQSSTSRRSTAGIYRELFYAAERGLRRGGQRRAQLLIGELAPLRSLGFYEQLMCMDSRGNLLRGGNATKHGCPSGRRIRRLNATGIAHHPYARGGGSPFRRQGRLDITLRDIDRLQDGFNRGARNRAVRRNLPVFVTEFGISSRPPSRRFGLSLSAQAREINRSEYNMWLRREIRSYAQFQLSDDVGIGRERGTDVVFQTGLRFGDNDPKPSLDAFRMPIFPVRNGNNVRVWGGVRPGAGDRVAVQVGRGNDFNTVRTVRVNRYGYINTSIRRPGSRDRIRLLWEGPNNQQFMSREAAVERSN